MTILNKTVTIQGSLTKVTGIRIVQSADGLSYNVRVEGVSTDGSSYSEAIIGDVSFPVGTTPTLDNMWSAALSKLRIANGLEV
jgi:hypothetical protein